MRSAAPRACRWRAATWTVIAELARAAKVSGDEIRCGGRCGPRPLMATEEQFDYIVIGAGSAGCTVAARLAEGRTRRVLVLEAGHWDRSIWIHVPIGFFRCVSNPRYNWGYVAEFDESVASTASRLAAGSCDRRQQLHQWTRLHPGPARGLRRLGRPLGERLGMGQRRVRYFDKAESRPAGVSDARYTHPLCDAFIEAAERCGVTRVRDFNGPSQAGAGYYRLNTRHGRRKQRGRRLSAPVTALPESRQCAPNSLVERLDVRDGQLRGIWYRRGGRSILLQSRAKWSCVPVRSARRSCCRSPASVPPTLLERIGVEVVRDVPAVGRNLQDHFASRSIRA